MLGLGLSIPQIAVLGAGRPRWLVPGPNGALPIQVSAWADNAGYVGGRVHASAAAYLAAAGGTFSRASDAWRRDVDRIWRKSGSNALRLHHDAAGNPLGLLIEGQRTFSLFPSRNFTTDWTKRGTCTATQDMAVARPDGTLGAMRIEGMTPGNNDCFRAFVSAILSQPCAPSFMLRRISTSGVLKVDNASDATKGIWLINLAILPDAWVRITRDHPAVTVVIEFETKADGGWGFRFSNNGSGTLAVYADFANAELANMLWASSPMDPSTGAATRLADNLSYPATASSEMTVVIDAITPPGWAGSHTLFHWSDGTANNRLRLFRDSSSGKLSLLSVIAGASAWYALSDDVISSGSRLQVALSLKAGAIAALVEGAAAKTYAPASPIPPGLTTIVECSSGAAEYWFGTEARLTRYAKAYAAADLPGLLS